MSVTLDSLTRTRPRPAEVLAPPTVAPRPARGRRGMAAGWTGVDLVVVLAVVAPSAYLPIFESWVQIPRTMGLLLVLPLGVVALSRLARDGSRAAVAAAAVVAWAVAGALRSSVFDGPGGVSITGDATVVTLAGAVAVWAAAHFLSPRGRRAVVPVVVGLCAVNVCVALAQVLFGAEGAPLPTVDGNATGLTSSTTYLGTLMAAGVALCVRRGATEDEPVWRWPAGALALGAGLALSGSIVALGALVVAVASIALLHSNLQTAQAAIAGAIGVLAGTMVLQFTGADARPGPDALDPLTSSGSWDAIVDAVAQRPLLGWGLGNERSAIVAQVGDGAVPTSSDQLDVVVGAVIALGVPGAVLLAAFVWLAAVENRSSTLVGAGTVALTWFFERAAIVTVPLAALLLGTADPEPGAATPRLDLGRTGWAVVLAAGVGPALWLGSTGLATGG